MAQPNFTVRVPVMVELDEKGQKVIIRFGAAGKDYTMMWSPCWGQLGPKPLCGFWDENEREVEAQIQYLLRESYFMKRFSNTLLEALKTEANKCESDSTS